MDQTVGVENVDRPRLVKVEFQTLRGSFQSVTGVGAAA
jgi:hypothetical protein